MVGIGKEVFPDNGVHQVCTLISKWLVDREVSKNDPNIAVANAPELNLDPVEIHSKFEWTTIIPFQSGHAVIAGRLEAGLQRGENVN